MPVESFLPMIFLRYLTGFAKDQTISPEHLEYGFDPEMLFEGVRPFPKKKGELLKEINSEFSVAEEGSDPKFIQLIVDENAINTFILDFVLVERAFSLRSFMRADPRFAEFLAQMKTDVIATLLPEFGEEFGMGKAIDLYFSLSHSLISNKLENAKASGFQMDKNGNFRFVFNFSVTMLVENKGGWQEARSIFISIMFKGKVIVEESDDGKRTMKLTPKMGEISDIKILNADDEQQVMEEMMIKSGFNLQMETVMKMIPPYKIPMQNPPTPPEMECLGFKFADFDVLFRKGYAELSFSYQKVDTPSDEELCEGFIDALRNGPQKAMDTASDYFGGRSPQELLDESKDLLDD